MARGDHIRVNRGIYSHHGIDCGDGTVIHYPGEVFAKKGSPVCAISLSDFLKGGTLEVVNYARCDSAEITLGRARSRIGEAEYTVWGNNCEHFARWCRTGLAFSEQVHAVKGTAGGISVGGAAAAGGLGAVSALGAVSGLSGAGMMSGLATIGGVVGGGAVAGLGTVAAAPAVVTVGAMHVVLGDDEALPHAERTARTVGRRATAAGAAAGVAGAVGAVYGAGSVVGLSAAGITSGLAGIGGVVGGGMFAGVAVATVGPAIGAAAVGYGAYRAWRWVTRC